MISFQSINVNLPPINRPLITAWVKRVADSYNLSVGNVAYIFVDDEKILEVNRQYLGHDYYTDIITFDYCTTRCISGDLFISLDTVCSNSQLLHTSYEDELHRVIIHGILHLCGINDKGPGERKKMERAEDEALALLERIKAEAGAQETCTT